MRSDAPFICSRISTSTAARRPSKMKNSLLLQTNGTTTSTGVVFCCCTLKATRNVGNNDFVGIADGYIVSADCNVVVSDIVGAAVNHCIDIVNEILKVVKFQ